NALATLPHPVYVDKIIFSVQSDPSGKIPPSMIKKPLDLTLESTLNEISDPEAKVRNAISAQYGLSSEELNSVVIRIRIVTVGVGSMIDDHAISLYRVSPQASG
ncbi:MAG: hypothetical protein MN733_11400, partial [Nitrososphaera sp.]|nr:hypothetical protein [Nitrososphaera sp.]